MRWRKPVAPLLALASLVGCGGGTGGGVGPTQPTAVATPTPTRSPTPTQSAGPNVVNGISGAALPAALIAPPAPTNGAAVSVRHDGFLTREQPFDGSTIFMWPGDEAYVRELVYDLPFRDGSRRLVRWPASGFTLTLDAELAGDPAVVGKVESVLAYLSSLTGLPMQIGAGGAAVLRVDAEENEENDSVAFVELRFNAAAITGADIVFESRAEITGARGASYANTFLHEMGHVLGMSHSPDVNDVMTAGEGPGTRHQEYQPNEAACARMMYVHRRAGNLPPDRDPALGAAAVGTWSVVILD